MHPARLFAGERPSRARELFEGIYHPEASLAVFFCSTDYELHALERELNAQFADVSLIGCTSAGNHARRLCIERHRRLLSARPDFITASV